MNRVITFGKPNLLKSGGSAAVLELTGGDRVQVVVWYAITLVGGSQQVLSTFSGYLLSAAAPSAEFVGKWTVLCIQIKI